MLPIFVGDVETTGVRPEDKIVELAYARIDANLNILFRDESLIDPEIPIPSGASAVHGITNARVADEPTIEQYMKMKGNPLMTDEPAILIAHNAPFDIRYFGPHMHPETEILCTLRLVKKLFPDLDSHKLQALKYSLNLPEVEGDAHRAGADVDMLINLVAYLMLHTGHDIYGLVDLSKQPLEIKKMPFGKHKGKPLSEVPKDYIDWLLKQDNVDQDLATSLKAVL